MTEVPSIPKGKRRLPPLFWVIAALSVLFALVGIFSIGLYVRQKLTPPMPLWAHPWQMPEPERISAGLAVWSLTGVSPDKVYRHAMANNELDTVAAMALLTPRLPSSQRLGWLTVLAQRFPEEGRIADAHVFLNYSTALVMLMPDLSDQLRANTLLQIADEWRALGEKDQALWTLEQALILAQYSPYLTKPGRKNLFIQIGEQYVQLGDPNRGQAVAAIPVLSNGIPQKATIPLGAVQEAPTTLPPSLQTLIQEREVAAQAYVDDWSQRGGEAAPGAAQALANSLIDEDLGRGVFYDNVLAREDITPEERTRVLFDRVAWRAIQYRAANRLFGASIVPQWEADKTAIGLSLRDAIVELHNQSTIWVDSLPQEQQPEARVVMDRLILGWGLLGLYVGANLELASDAMNQDIAAWQAAGVFPRAIVKNGVVHVELFYQPPSEESDISSVPLQE